MITVGVMSVINRSNHSGKKLIPDCLYHYKHLWVKKSIGLGIIGIIDLNLSLNRHGVAEVILPKIAANFLAQRIRSSA